MVEITVPLVLDVIRTSGILVGIVYYFTIMRNSQRNQQLALESRQIATYIQTLGFRDKEFMKAWADIGMQEYSDFEDFLSKYYYDVDVESWSSFFSVGNMYHSVGHLVELGILTPEIVYKQEGELVIYAWETQRMVIEGFRTHRGYLHFFDYYESLYEHMVRLRDQELNP